MFAIAIAEKGGSQRRLQFDKEEVTIGRVQGNDVVLPKGNVSKRHSRLVLQEGQFVVSDLKSTNGTYVNGRKITSPQAVKPGDKIYIGDFILTVEQGASDAEQAPASPGSGQAAAPPQPPPTPQGEARASQPQPPPPPQEGSAGVQPPAPPQPPSSSSPDGAQGERPQPPPLRSDGPPPPPSSPSGRAAPPPPPPSSRQSAQQAPAADPQRASGPPPEPAQAATTPAPEGVPEARAEPTDPPTKAYEAAASAPAAAPSPTQAPTPSPADPAAADGGGGPEAVPAGSAPSGREPTPAAAPRPSRPARPAARTEGQRWQLGPTLGRLMARMAEHFDIHDTSAQALDDAQRRRRAREVVDRALEELRNDGGLDAGVDASQLAEAAVREAAGLGAVEPLLDNDSVREIVVEGPQHVMADFGDGFEPVRDGFSSGAAVLTAANRLLAHAGVPPDANESVSQAVLPKGAHVTVVRPPVALRGPVIEVRRVRPAPPAEQLVQDGMLNEDMLQLLRRAVQAHANVVVLGPAGSGVTTMLGALASLGDTRERIITVEDVSDLNIARDHVVALSTGTSRSGLTVSQVLKQATRLRGDRVVIDDIRGSEAFDALMLLASQGRGCLLGVHAHGSPGPLDALRLLARLDRAVSDTTTLDALLAHAARVLVELDHTPYGPRVVRIGEVARGGGGVHARDLYTYQNGFHSTGATPSF